MGNRNRSNVLLVEILIAILFFMLSATVLVQVFAGARTLTIRAGAETRALADAQNVAETLYAAEDPEAELEALGFKGAHGAWTRDYGDYTLYVASDSVDTDAGALWKGEISALYHNRNVDRARQEDDEMFSLPCTRYKEGRR